MSLKCTNCHVILTGFLKETSQIFMNVSGDLVLNAVVTASLNQQDALYQIVLLNDAALRVKKFGFENLCLLVEGFLVSVESIYHIVSEKVVFLTGSGPVSSDLDYFSLVAMNGCFPKNEYLLKNENEIALIH